MKLPHVQSSRGFLKIRQHWVNMGLPVKQYACNIPDIHMHLCKHFMNSKGNKTIRWYFEQTFEICTHIYNMRGINFVHACSISAEHLLYSKWDTSIQLCSLFVHLSHLMLCTSTILWWFLYINPFIVTDCMIDAEWGIQQ